MSVEKHNRKDAGHKANSSGPHKPRRTTKPEPLPDDEAALIVVASSRSKTLPDGATFAQLSEEWQEACFAAVQPGEIGPNACVQQSALRSKPEKVEAIRAALDRAWNNDTGTLATSKPPIPSDEELGLIDLSTVTPTEVRWLWPNRIPLGKITLLAGEGGIGKTFLTLDIIATVTRGRPFADTPDHIPEPAGAIFLTAEDDLSDTIVPRLMKMGGDLTRVKYLGTAKLASGKLHPFTLADIGRLEATMAKYPDIRLIIIDPVTSFLGRGIDDGKNAELRTILGPLADFAGRFGVAIVCITHFNKSASPSAAARVMGSVAYSNAARATWVVIMDPEHDERRMMLPVKNNLSPDRTGMAYTLIDGAIEWERDPISAKVNEVLAKAATAQGGARTDNAIRIIRAVLGNGQLSPDEFFERCKDQGVSKNAIYAHKDAAGAFSKRIGFGPGSYCVWMLKPPTPDGQAF